MSLIIKQLIDAILLLIAPPFCAHCKQWLDERAVFCAACINSIQPIIPYKLVVTQTVSVPVFAVSNYQDPLRSLILAKHRSHDLASKQLAQLIVQYTPLKNMPIDCIVPVPLHWSRQARRGYNQATVIAHEVARGAGGQVKPLLRRVRSTRFQALLSRAARQENVQGVFDLHPDALGRFNGKHLLLVDDLMTTGATLKAACRVLLQGKPASITVVVACRVV